MKRDKSLRVYMQYINDESDTITLSFRNENSFLNFIEQNKISEKSIIYKSKKPPFIEDAYPSGYSIRGILNTLDTCVRMGSV